MITLRIYWLPSSSFRDPKRFIIRDSLPLKTVASYDLTGFHYPTRDRYGGELLSELHEFSGDYFDSPRNVLIGFTNPTLDQTDTRLVLPAYCRLRVSTMKSKTCVMSSECAEAHIIEEDRCLSGDLKDYVIKAFIGEKTIPGMKPDSLEQTSLKAF
jgi:hypothetical protein